MDHTHKAGRSGKAKPLVPEDNSSQHLLYKFTPDKYRKKLVALVQIDSADQVKISLGVYGPSSPPKGFFLEYIPDPEPETIIDSKIISLSAGQSSMYELKLIIANYGQEPITTKVWEIE